MRMMSSSSSRLVIISIMLLLSLTTSTLSYLEYLEGGRETPPPVKMGRQFVETESTRHISKSFQEAVNKEINSTYIGRGITFG
ncbi:hypothetical protein DRN46_00085 [Thermococci archaeon]|nr:MAG: hypothetical protein DRN46_00085 [Thermococci archaeon]RLF96396.1 MAG: hypothetical protein DRN52_02480 [Thermococci archaeon]